MEAAATLTQSPALKVQLQTMDRLPSLYHLTAEVAAILSTDEEDPEAMEKLSALLPKLEHKAAALAHFIQLGQDLSSVLKAREEAVKKARQAQEAAVDRALAYLKACMEQAEIMKLTDKRTGTTIALQLNPPRVEVDDPSVIPDRFWVTPEPPPMRVDNAALLVALKAARDGKGDPIPGARLVQGQRVVIK